MQYAGPNPVAYDIANYWCEWAADYHTDTPHLLDYSLMPDAQQQVLLLLSSGLPNIPRVHAWYPMPCGTV